MLHGAERIAQPGDQWLHLRAVRCIAHFECARFDTTCGQQCRHGCQRCVVPGQHNRLWRVDRRDADAILEAGDRLGSHARGNRKRDHGAQPFGLTHCLATEHGNTRTFIERDRAGRARSGNLTHAVPDHEIRIDTPRPPECDQSHLDREHRRLCDLCFMDARCHFVAAEFLQQIPPCHTLHRG